ncbi:HD-GYP domain-containing protein [Mycoplasmatota bacterium]|nr:HD-GYP domain-containing protein [Mycoplasmatota bacterium]
MIFNEKFWEKDNSQLTDGLLQNELLDEEKSSKPIILSGFPNYKIISKKDKVKNPEFFKDLISALSKLKIIRGEDSHTQKEILKSLITGLEFHDKYTSGHSDAVSVISLKIGKSMGLTDSKINDLHLAALVHDIGKIIIPTDILNKTTKLTEEEFSLIKSHCKAGFDILTRTTSLNDIANYVLHHHERWDGKGYPNRIKGKQIPIISQIIAVADAWSAMTSDRPYRGKLDKCVALEELLQNRGTQFSPEVVDAYTRVLSIKS